MNPLNGINVGFTTNPLSHLWTLKLSPSGTQLMTPVTAIIRPVKKPDQDNTAQLEVKGHQVKTEHDATCWYCSLLDVHNVINLTQELIRGVSQGEWDVVNDSDETSVNKGDDILDKTIKVPLLGAEGGRLLMPGRVLVTVHRNLEVVNLINIGAQAIARRKEGIYREPAATELFHWERGIGIPYEGNPFNLSKGVLGYRNYEGRMLNPHSRR